MGTLLRRELDLLLETRPGPHVSIFLPTHRAGRETQQDPIRLKNLLAEAEERLAGLDVRTPNAVDLMTPARALLNDGLFWQRQEDGLALFLAPDVFRSYSLPLGFGEFVVVGEQFYIKPLLPLFQGNLEYFILALSQNAIRFYQADRFSIAEVEVPDIPSSLEEALQYDDMERELQFHTRTDTPRGGERAATFFGTGAKGEEDKTNLLRYFQKVAPGVENNLSGRQAPLVLAGVDYLLPLYKRASSYGNIVDGGIEGNPEKLDTKVLHEKSWELIKPRAEQGQAEAMERYAQLEGNRSPKAANELKSILPAALNGRVQVLFVPRDEQQWGVYDPNKNVTKLHKSRKPGDIDLLDYAAAQTLGKGGTVYAVETEGMPNGHRVAAIFYY